MLIVIGEATAASGRREEMVDAVAEMARGTRPDDGCQLYGFYADVTNPDVILSVEVWRDRAALDAHMGTSTPRPSSRPCPRSSRASQRCTSSMPNPLRSRTDDHHPTRGRVAVLGAGRPAWPPRCPLHQAGTR